MNQNMKVRAILMDCDGVLTDGTYYYSENGKTMKLFSSIDSKGINMALDNGIKIGVISEDLTGYTITEARCKDIGILSFSAKNPEDKLIIAKKLLEEWGIRLKDCAFIGDDIGDVPVMENVGFPVAVRNATDVVKDLVKERGGFVTDLEGGHGAVREAIEKLLNPSEK